MKNHWYRLAVALYFLFVRVTIISICPHNWKTYIYNIEKKKQLDVCNDDHPTFGQPLQLLFHFFWLILFAKTVMNEQKTEMLFGLFTFLPTFIFLLAFFFIHLNDYVSSHWERITKWYHPIQCDHCSCWKWYFVLFKLVPIFMFCFFFFTLLLFF